LGFEVYKESYSGAIREITLGKGDKAITLGGETSYPFYGFEGGMPNKPRIAMEIWDMEPDDWPESVRAPFADVMSDPAAWAKKCVDTYGADMIVLQLKSTDPNSKDASPEAAAKIVKKVLDAIDVPLVLWGTANVQKDEAVLKKLAEECQGKNLTIGPVEDKNHKGIGASAMGYGHTVISSSPIDVNLAKQINILLENLGVSPERMIIDPTTGGLGYGMEYSYSVMERIRMAALVQGDDKLQLPIINNLANEIWKCKEAKQGAQEAPTLGDPEKRPILMEAVAAVCYLLGGSDVLIMRHPEAVRMARSFIDLITQGGKAEDIAPIEKRLEPVAVDLAALSAEPDLTIPEEKQKKAAPAKKAAPKAAAEPAPAKVEKKPAAKPAPAPKPAAEAVKKAEPTATVEAEKKAKEERAVEAEADAKARAEEAARKKAEEEAREKAAQAAKAQAQAEAKVKAEAEAKAKAEQEARDKRNAEEAAMREKRRQEREARAAQRKTEADKATAMTAAAEQKDPLDKMIARLDRIHRRAA